MVANTEGLMKKHKSVRRIPAPKGSVFVVDDNAMLAELAAAVLEAAGYTVKHFLDPKAVLLAMQEANPKPAVLVTDFEMGSMNGLELIESSHKIHPALKTLLVSGTVDGSIALAHAAKVNGFLGKPYDPAHLRKAVAELMGQ
jgi:DNA-binding NtrC family response regulator